MFVLQPADTELLTTIGLADPVIGAIETVDPAAVTFYEFDTDTIRVFGRRCAIEEACGVLDSLKVKYTCGHAY